MVCLTKWSISFHAYIRNGTRLSYVYIGHPIPRMTDVLRQDPDHHGNKGPCINGHSIQRSLHIPASLLAIGHNSFKWKLRSYEINIAIGLTKIYECIVSLKEINSTAVHCWVDWCHTAKSTGLILGLRPANKRRRYFVTTSLIGWSQA